MTAEFQINKDHIAYKKVINHGLNSEEDLILRRVLTKEGISNGSII